MAQQAASDIPSGWFEQPKSATDTPSPQTARHPTYIDAIKAAMEDELAEDERVVLMGEDIATMGGAFRATEGLVDKFGEQRVIDTPIAEIAIAGSAIGMAISGMRPIAEMQFADFISCAYDQIVNEAAKLYFRFQVPVPMVIRAPAGGGVGAGPFHSQNPEAIFAHTPGLKIVCPGTVQDAYDLLRLAVADPNPVLYFEHKALYRSIREPLERRKPEGSLGQAAVRRAGTDVTVVSYAHCLQKSLQAADALANEGLDVEVIDLRSIVPLDFETIKQSARKTSRVVIVHEDTRTLGIGAEIGARLADECFFDLDAPVMRVTAPDTPVPFARPLEDVFNPSVARITDAIRECARI